MPIVAAYMVPHPPMIIPQVGRGSEKQVQKTIDAYRAVAAEIAALASAVTVKKLAATGTASRAEILAAAN